MNNQRELFKRMNCKPDKPKQNQPEIIDKSNIRDTKIRDK